MNASSKFKLLLSAFLVVILVSSCIPSLHPIYTDATREVDDRLLGTWSTVRAATVNDISYDVTISSAGDTTIYVRNAEDGKPNSGPELPDNLVKAFSSFGMSSDAAWTFEQAASITFKKGKGKFGTTIKMTPGVPSFAPEGYVVENQEMLPYYILTHKDLELDGYTTTHLIVNMTEIGGDMYLDFMPFPKGDKLRQGAFGVNYIAGHTFAKLNFDNDKLNLEMFDGEFIENMIKSRKVRLRHEKLGLDGDVVLTASTKELRAFIAKYGSNPDLFDGTEVLVQL